MKIQRFFAKDTRTAMRQVRDTLGPDAVILSNRRVPGGVEILCTLEFDQEAYKAEQQRNQQQAARESEVALHINKSPAIQQADEQTIAISSKQSMANRNKKSKLLDNDYRSINTREAIAAGAHLVEGSTDMNAMREELHSLRGLLEHQLSGLAWNDLKVRKPQEAELLRQFLVMGLEVRFAKQLAAQMSNIIAENADYRSLWRESLDKLTALVPTVGHDVVANGGIIALVGPTGVGKTTTIAKLAARYVMQHGPDSVGLITLDNNRIGALEQLKTYARILGIPLRVAEDGEKLNRIIEAFYDKKLVLIDTPGDASWSEHILAQLHTVKQEFGKLDIYLTLSATAQYSMLNNSVLGFQHKHLRGAIITKLDEAASLGEIISILIAHDLPAVYLSDGQSISENLRVALAEQMVSFAVQVGQAEAGSNEEETLAVRLHGNIADAK